MAWEFTRSSQRLRKRLCPMLGDMTVKAGKE
nr:MAG TPA: hypothetical protein [Caudoviricetes sp.]